MVITKFMNNYLPLSYITNFLKIPLLEVIKFQTDSNMTRLNVRDIIDSDTLLLLEDVVNSSIDHCVMFKSDPGFKLNIHSDNGSVNGSNVWAINAVYLSNNHAMNWYSSDNPPVRMINKIGSHYYSYDDSVLTQIESACISVPTLVRTDIPHNVVNSDNNARICISIRSNVSRLNWEQVYTNFLNYKFAGK